MACAFTFAHFFAFAGAADAAPPREPKANAAVVQEAKERFDRGLKLFDSGDSEGALAEFLRAYELAPNPYVQLNIALVYARLSRPVEALRALDDMLAHATEVDPTRLAQAKTLREAQADRVAEVDVETVAGAVIEVDGVTIGSVPLARPLLIASGTHTIGALAAGFQAARKTLTLAGRTRSQLKLELVPVAAQRGLLDVRCVVPGADVFVDGALVGTTPLTSPLVVASGQHRVELRRNGYRTAGLDVTLSTGAVSSVTLELEEDGKSLGSLRIDSDPSEATVVLDGKTRGSTGTVLIVPIGLHTLRVEEPGFLRDERTIRVGTAGLSTVRIVLSPTAETRSTRLATARTWKRLGYGFAGGGGLVLGASVVALLLNHVAKNSAQRDYDAFLYSAERNAGRSCDPGRGTTSDGLPINRATCESTAVQASESLSGARNRETLFFVTAGVGAVALAAGVIAILASPRGDPTAVTRPVGRFRLEPFADAGARAVIAF